MSLLDSIKADEEALAKLQEEPKKELKEEAEEEQVEKEPKEPKEEPVEKQAKEDNKIDNAAYAKMRIEKAAAEAKAKQLEERLAALEKEKQEPKETDENEEQSIELPPEIQDLVYERKIQAAKDHFTALEQEFIGGGDVPDYDAHIKGYAIALYQSIATLNPNLTERQVEKETERRILTEAAKYHAAGKNAAEEIYNIAKARGYKYNEPKQEEKKEEVRTPNLDRVAENKKRSSGMGAAGGSSSETTTIKAALDMPLGQFASIPAAELERLVRGGK